VFVKTDVPCCDFLMLVVYLQSLAFGADSNGSGVVALLELARLFAKLYASSRSHARYVGSCVSLSLDVGFILSDTTCDINRGR